MRRLLGYCCHVASVRLHWVAVDWLRPDEHWVPEMVRLRRYKNGGWAKVHITLADVAPRLAAVLERMRGER